MEVQLATFLMVHGHRVMTGGNALNELVLHVLESVLLVLVLFTWHNGGSVMSVNKYDVKRSICVSPSGEHGVSHATTS